MNSLGMATGSVTLQKLESRAVEAAENSDATLGTVPAAWTVWDNHSSLDSDCNYLWSRVYSTA